MPNTLEKRVILRPYWPSRTNSLAPTAGTVIYGLGALLGLEDEKGREQWLFLAPDAAGLKVDVVGQLVTVITPRSPLGKSLLGKFEGDEVEILVAGARQQFAVTEVI